LCQLDFGSHPDLLTGAEGNEDAGVFRLRDDLAIINTTDFFPPIVDDPYDFGRIAACNALNDVYAMGGKPVTALNIVAFPIGKLPDDYLVQILKGGLDKCHEAGCLVVGGHSIEDEEPKFDLAVTGVVHPDKIMMNSCAKAGDILYLTKPLGTGIMSTAIKQGREVGGWPTAIESMAMLNKAPCEAMVAAGARAATDVTGFGLIGHLTEMCVASKVGAEVALEELPRWKDAARLAEEGVGPGGLFKNLSHYSEWVLGGMDKTNPLHLIVSDPQTAGGLLIAISEDRAPMLDEEMQKRGAQYSRIGRFTAEHPGKIALR